MLRWGAGRGLARWGPSGDPTASAIIAAMTPPPDATREALIRSTVTALNPIWPKIDEFFITAAHAAQPGQIDWRDPTAIGLIAQNSPAFVADRGFTGDGVASGLATTGRNINTLANYRQDSASMWAWSRTDGTGAGADFGTQGAGQPYFIIRNTGNNLLTRFNSNTNSLVANAGAIGLFGATRNNSADCQPYKNGAALGGASAAVSAALVAQPFCICRGQALFSVRQIAAGGCGGYLTPSEWTLLYNALNTYLTAVGAAP